MHTPKEELERFLILYPEIAELHSTAAKREDVGSCRSVGPTGEQEDTTETEAAPTNGPNAPECRTNRKIGNGLSAASGRRAYM
jgi:hypothetical protein